MVFGFGQHHKQQQDAWNTVYSPNQMTSQQPQGSWTYELVAAAAAFEAMNLYENKRQQEGYQDHRIAREVVAAIAAAEVDNLVETKGLTYLNRNHTRQLAMQQAQSMYDTHYMGGGQHFQPTPQQQQQQQQQQQFPVNNHQQQPMQFPMGPSYPVGQQMYGQQYPGGQYQGQMYPNF